MKSNRRDAARRKLLNILPRLTLEDLSELSRPYMETKTTLVDAAVSKWNAEEVQWALDKIMKDANL